MDRLIIIRRPTRLDALVARFNTKQQAQFYIEHLNADFKDYEAEHETYYAVLDRLVKTAQGIGNVQVIDWKFLPNFIFGKNDTVITVGQDGLIANTLKYLEAQKLIGINPDPSRWDGVLSQFSVDEAGTVIRQALNDEAAVKQVTKAKVQLSDNQVQRLFSVLSPPVRISALNRGWEKTASSFPTAFKMIILILIIRLSRVFPLQIPKAISW